MSRRSFWPAALVCLALAAVPAWAALGLSDRVLALEDRASVDPRGTIVELQRLRGEAVGAEQVQLLVLLGATLDFDGDPEGAQAVALALEGVDDPSAASAALMLRARLMLTRGTADRALKLARAAQAALPAAAPPWLRLHLAATLADAQSAAGRADEAIRHQLQTIELADQDGHARYRANTRRHLAWRYLTLGQLERARVLVAEAVALADPLRWPIVHAQALQLEGFVLLDMGQRDAAFTRLQMALSLSREAHSPVWEAQMLANLADYHLRSGEYQEAEAVAERALPMARAQKDPQMESVALANRGLARVMLGRVADGRRDLADALAIDERMGDVSSMAQTLLETGQYLERAGEHDAAWQAYVKLRPLSQQVDQAEQQKAILRLQEDFDQRQRERELRLLEQEAALNEAVLAKQRLRLSIGWLAAAAALLVLGLTVLLARRVRHANRALSDVNAELLALSERDPLTGLANRRRLMREMAAQARHGPLEGSLFLVDIDHFKHLNDRHGHAAGDAVLVETAGRLCDAVRDGDLVVRWGGEEFLVVARGVDPDDAERIAQRMLQGIAGEPVRHEGVAIGFTASVGYARFPLQPGPVSVDWDKAIDLVDAALYLAKAHGRNRGYGIVRLRAGDAQDLATITSSLEASQERGRVDLRLLQGPPLPTPPLREAAA